MKYILAFDQNILFWLNSRAQNWGLINKILAQWLVYLVPVILLWLWFFSEKTKKVAIRAFLSVMLAWPALALIIGKVVNRPRPFELQQVRELLFHPPTYSFPSDHAAALFALCASFWFSGYKKLALYVFVMAIVVSLFRVATGLHFPTDILAGAVLGIFSAWVVFRLDKLLNPIYEIVIKIARRIRLA